MLEAFQNIAALHVTDEIAGKMHRADKFKDGSVDYFNNSHSLVHCLLVTL
jgi:hypothetical protein